MGVVSAGCCIQVLGEMFLSLPYVSVVLGYEEPVWPLAVRTESSRLHPVRSSKIPGRAYGEQNTKPKGHRAVELAGCGDRSGRLAKTPG